jgi:hypothetical protein
MASPVMGLTAMSPVMTEPGTVEIPSAKKMMKKEAA